MKYDFQPNFIIINTNLLLLPVGQVTNIVGDYG